MSTNKSKSDEFGEEAITTVSKGDVSKSKEKKNVWDIKKIEKEVKRNLKMVLIAIVMLCTFQK